MTEKFSQKTGPLRLAIAGLGLVGKRHAESIKYLNGIELCAVVDPGEDGKKEAQKLSVPCYDTVKDMLHSEVPDGVILSTPTRLHVEQGLECIDAHCPVLIEKPLATNYKDAEVLIDTSVEKKIPILVGHHRRHNPIIQKAHELISSGEIGTVRAIHANCWFYKPDEYFDIAPWRKLNGAGPISVNLVHDVDLIRYFCGEVLSVQAQATKASRGFENEDVAAAVLKFESGAIATISVSDSVVSPWSWEMTSKEYPIYPKTQESCYLIGGSHGSMSIPDMKIWNHSERRDWWSPISATSISYENSDPLIMQMKHFSSVVRGEVEPLVSGQEGLKTLRVIEAIQNAALSGETIYLKN